jgi:hypothetical protein
MWWIAGGREAAATPMTMCAVAPLAADCSPAPTASEPGVVRFRVGCVTHSAAPGGPVATTPESAFQGRVTLEVAGRVAGGPLAPTERCGPGTYEREGRFVAGTEVLVRSADRPSDEPLGRLRVGPDLSAASRCLTNPDTCIAAADAVPAELAPWLRLHACWAGDCSALGPDAASPALRSHLEAGCTLFQRAPCAVLAAVAPAEGWPLAALSDPGEGPVAKRLTAVQPLPLDLPATVRWRGGVPVVTPPSDTPPSPRSADGAVVATWSRAGVEVRDAHAKLLWRWTGEGVQEVDVRPDGAQLLVRFPALVVRVPLDGSTAWLAPSAEGFPTAPGRLEGTLLRPDGWPAVGARVSRCAEGQPLATCSARADLLGRFALPGAATGGDVAHVSGPGWLGEAGADVVVVRGLPTRLPERVGAFSFEVDDERRVLRAAPPLRVGDVVVEVGPLAVSPDGEGDGAHLPGAVLPLLADGWGWVIVERDGGTMALP